jgi:hypothetical protein
MNYRLSFLASSASFAVESAMLPGNGRACRHKAIVRDCHDTSPLVLRVVDRVGVFEVKWPDVRHLVMQASEFAQWK